MCLYICMGTWGGKRRALGSLGLGLQEVSSLMWVLRFRLHPSTRAANVLLAPPELPIPQSHLKRKWTWLGGICSSWSFHLFLHLIFQPLQKGLKFTKYQNQSIIRKHSKWKMGHQIKTEQERCQHLPGKSQLASADPFPTLPYPFCDLSKAILAPPVIPAPDAGKMTSESSLLVPLVLPRLLS